MADDDDGSLGIKWPKWVKRRIPRSILAIIGLLWLFGGKPTTNYVQQLLVHQPAQIAVKPMGGHLFQIVIRIAPSADKAFEEVKVRVDVDGSVEAKEGYFVSLAENKKLLHLVQADNGRIMYAERLEEDEKALLRLVQRERLEITVNANSDEQIKEISITSKDRPQIAFTDWGQWVRRSELPWRLILLSLLFLLVLAFREPIVRLASPARTRQLEADQAILSKCFLEQEHRP